MHSIFAFVVIVLFTFSEDLCMDNISAETNTTMKHSPVRGGIFPNNKAGIRQNEHTCPSTLKKDFVILQLYWWLFNSTKHCSWNMV